MQSSELKPFLRLGQVSEKGEFTPFGIEEIELADCNWAFIRGVDGFGKISTDLHGGNISFISAKIPSVGMLEWGVKSNKYYSGYVHFRNEEGKAVSRLFFEHAACVHLKISYVNEGTPYMMMQGTLQANVLTPDGAIPYMNRWKNQKYMDDSYNAATEAKEEAASLAGMPLNTEVSLSAYMTLNGEEYGLDSFEMEFAQEVHSINGEPQTTVRGGFAHVTLDLLPDQNINKWLRSPDNQRANGEFRFGDPAYGYPLTIKFTDAACAGLFGQCSVISSQNTLTRLNIAPMTLSLNGVEYRNHSVKEPEKYPSL